MSELTTLETRGEALRLVQLLEETLDRHAGKGEAERAAALTRTLRDEIASIPPPKRRALLAELGALRSDDPVTDGSAALRIRDLEAENARLRAALAVAPAAHAPMAPPSSGDFAAAMAAVLLGAGRDAGAFLAQDDAEARLVGVVRMLTSFVSELARSFLGALADPDQTMSGRLATVIADELEGRVAAGTCEALITQIRRQIGGQLLAFREACDSGVHDLLRQLAPAALAASSAQGGVRIVGSRPFYYRECWERFEKAFEDLRTADNLYEAYFDGAYRKALHRVGAQGQRGKGTK